MKKSNFYEGQLLTPQDLNGLQDDVEKSIDRIPSVLFWGSKITGGFDLTLIHGENQSSFFRDKKVFITSGRGFTTNGHFISSLDTQEIDVSVYPNEKKEYQVFLIFHRDPQDRTPNVVDDRPDIDVNEEDVLYVIGETFSVKVVEKDTALNLKEPGSQLYIGAFEYNPHIKPSEVSEGKPYIVLTDVASHFSKTGIPSSLHHLEPEIYIKEEDLGNVEKEESESPYYEYDHHGRLKNYIGIFRMPPRGILRASPLQEKDVHPSSFVTFKTVSNLMSLAGGGQVKHIWGLLGDTRARLGGDRPDEDSDTGSLYGTRTVASHPSYQIKRRGYKAMDPERTGASYSSFDSARAWSIFLFQGHAITKGENAGKHFTYVLAQSYAAYTIPSHKDNARSSYFTSYIYVPFQGWSKECPPLILPTPYFLDPREIYLDHFDVRQHTAPNGKAAWVCVQTYKNLAKKWKEIAISLEVRGGLDTPFEDISASPTTLYGQSDPQIKRELISDMNSVPYRTILYPVESDEALEKWIGERTIKINEGEENPPDSNAEA